MMAIALNSQTCKPKRTNLAFVHSRQPENSEHSNPLLVIVCAKIVMALWSSDNIFAHLSLLGTNLLDKICWMISWEVLILNSIGSFQVEV